MGGAIRQTTLRAAVKVGDTNLESQREEQRARAPAPPRTAKTDGARRSTNEHKDTGRYPNTRFLASGVPPIYRRSAGFSPASVYRIDSPVNRNRGGEQCRRMFICWQTPTTIKQQAVYIRFSKLRKPLMSASKMSNTFVFCGARGETRRATNRPKTEGHK